MDAGALMRVTELNLAAHAALLHGFVPGATTRERGDFQICDSGLDHDTYNTVSRVAFTDGFAPEVVRTIADEVRAAGRPFSWWVAETQDQCDRRSLLTESGFAAGESETAMTLLLSDVTYPDRDSGAEIRKVTSSSAMAEYASILAANWDPPAAAVRDFLELASAGRPWESPESRFLVAYLDGRPVAGAEVFISNGVAGIYGVATLRQHRGRGIATDLMAAVLRDLAGIDVAVLQATADGSSIYRRLGFVPVGAFTEFNLQE